MKHQGRVVALVVSILITVFSLVNFAAPAAVRAMPAGPSTTFGVAQAGGIVATVWVNLLNVRRAPRITSSTKGRLVKGENVLLLGRVASGAWVEAQTRFGIGWLDRGWLTYPGTVLDLPVVPVLPPFLTSTNGLSGSYLRRGPDDKYPIIGLLTDGTEVDIVGFFDRPRWYLIAQQNGQMGWIFSGAVDVTGDISGVPAANALPSGMVNTYNLQVHTAPDINAPVVGDIRQGFSFDIIGRDFRTNWWQIQGKFGTGWVWAKYLVTVGDINLVPITDGAGQGHPILQ